MKKLSVIFLTLFLIPLIVFSFSYFQKAQRYGAPPYIVEDNSSRSIRSFDDYSDWKRPEGPFKVALQAGHWKNSELPDELARIRESGGGTASKEGIAEWEVNLAVAKETKKILEKKGMIVEILPAKVPPSYWADVFISIHADGSLDPLKSGFKAAAPRRDMTGKASDLVEILEEQYGYMTKLRKDPNISRNMTGYYAFSWRRFDHAIHPMTPAAILETGFLTNASDANMLINNPEISAKAIANAIVEYLELT